MARCYDMVKPKFLNLDIEIWVHPEKLGVSRPSLCLFHSSKHAGNQLLSALNEMQIEGCPSRRTLTFKPTERRGSLSTLRFVLVAECTDLRVMNIAFDTNAATIQITPTGLTVLQNGIEKWLDGCEDFGISSRHSEYKRGDLGKLDRASGELWFWGPTLIGP